MAQPSRPLIGLNVDFIPGSKTSRPHLRLNQGYTDAVLTAGGLPVLMPILGRDGDIRTFLEPLDGFILTSGLDMDPRRQGLPRHHAVTPMNERREEHDRILVRMLIDRQIPVLGIGVGMHQLNVATGGTLFMHLPEDCPRTMPHCDPTSHGPHRHLVNLKAGSRLEEIYGGTELLVNSNHHQAIKQTSDLFRVAAVAPDGVIEAMEALDPNWFCIAIQWHPEADQSSALDAQLFECFVQTCARQSAGLAIAA
ncbi:MAG: gamma-glutamyl-gamma-aminobutyrate hydrolase family protein [Planctomycetes bacterium]|nr:gamma-glutamyl-gamma-aminobutyrate hydrolase family protein [Planctomycetota bacterium]